MGGITFVPNDSPANESRAVAGASSWVNAKEEDRRIGEYFATLWRNSAFFRVVAVVLFGAPFIPFSVRQKMLRIVWSYFIELGKWLLFSIPWSHNFENAINKADAVLMEYLEQSSRDSAQL